MAKPKATKMHAVLGRCRRRGRWFPAARSSTIALLGSCHLDLRQAQTGDEERIHMAFNVVLGSVTVIVPPGVEVRPSGLVALASSRVDVPPEDGPDFPLIDVAWNCVLGRIRIVSETALVGGVPAAGDGLEGQEEEASSSSAVATAADTPVRDDPGSGVPLPAVEATGVGFDDLAQDDPAGDQETDTDADIDADDADDPVIEVEPVQSTELGFVDLAS